MTARGFEALLPSLERHGASVERSLGRRRDRDLRNPCGPRGRRAARGLRRGRDARPARRLPRGARAPVGSMARASRRNRHGRGPCRPRRGPAVRDGSTRRRGASPAAGRRRRRDARGRAHASTRRARGRRCEAAEEHVRLVRLRASAPVRERRFDSPMVGRERERRRLDDAFEQATGDRSCQLFTILGAAGVGKSRLVEEFVADLDSDTTLVARGRCLPYGEGITYWPVLEVVRDAAGIDDAARSEATSRGCSRCSREWTMQSTSLGALGEVVGVVGADERCGGDVPWPIRTFVEALARRRPLVLVFDDIHWGESTFLDLVDYIADWARDAPILLLCLARPELHELRPQWGGGKLNATSVHLEPLSESRERTARRQPRGRGRTRGRGAPARRRGGERKSALRRGDARARARAGPQRRSVRGSADDPGAARRSARSLARRRANDPRGSFGRGEGVPRVDRRRARFGRTRRAFAGISSRSFARS